MTTPIIRLLTAGDAPAYQALRLEALQNNPESYLATHETEKAKRVDAFARELLYATSSPVSGYYGIFLEEKLIGYANLDQVFLPKQRHIAYLYNLYITPNQRGNGYATQLFAHLAQLGTTVGIERIFITCNRKNTPAQTFYKKLGFKQYSIREKSVKWHDEYDDEIEMVREL